jgi:hypothetical protein
MRIFFLLLFFVAGSVWSEDLDNPNKLPVCPKELYYPSYDNCWGTSTYGVGKYIGEYKNGKRNGIGMFTTYGASERNAELKIIQPIIAKYVGEWKEDKKNGQGTFTTTAGGKYDGKWKDDVINGQGTLTYLNGDKYVGEWKDGKRNGQGTYTSISGKIMEGIWENGNLVNSGKSSKGKTTAEVTQTQDSKIVDTEFSINEAKQKCKDLGFKENTEKFGACVLKISK